MSVRPCSRGRLLTVSCCPIMSHFAILAVTNKNYLLCAKSEKYLFWVTETVVTVDFFVKVVKIEKIKTPLYDRALATAAQCAPSIFILDQKFHGLSYFWGIDIHEAVQNQSRKTSVIRLPIE